MKKNKKERKTWMLITNIWETIKNTQTQNFNPELVRFQYFV